MLRDVLKLIITGNEHSGTTICSRIFQCCSSLATGSIGAECGILSTPNGIKGFMRDNPYADITHKSWYVSRQNLQDIVNSSENFEMFYRQIREKSTSILNKNIGLIDKTPRYNYFLDVVLERTEDVPIVVMRKDPKNQIASLVKRGLRFHVAKSNFEMTYVRFNDLMKNTNRIKVVQFEDFILNPISHIKQIHNMMNIDYKEEDYKDIQKFMRGDAESYKKILTSQQIELINNELSEFIVV